MKKFPWLAVLVFGFLLQATSSVAQSDKEKPLSVQDTNKMIEQYRIKAAREQEKKTQVPSFDLDNLLQTGEKQRTTQQTKFSRRGKLAWEAVKMQSDLFERSTKVAVERWGSTRLLLLLSTRIIVAALIIIGGLCLLRYFRSRDFQCITVLTLCLIGLLLAQSNYVMSTSFAGVRGMHSELQSLEATTESVKDEVDELNETIQTIAVLFVAALKRHLQ